MARVSKIAHSRNYFLSDIILTFARLSLTIGQVSYVLLSSSLPLGKLAWLIPNQIAATSSRIN